jgi:hypothetical protein
MIDLEPRRLQIFGNAAPLSASVTTIARARGRELGQIRTQELRNFAQICTAPILSERG